MYPISDTFRAALTASHRIGVQATLYTGLSGTKLTDLDVLDGNVTVDITNAVRRRCQISLTDPTGTLTPASATDMLMPFGRELTLFRGITYPTVPDSLIPLGVFRLSDVDIRDQAGALTITLAGSDRSRAVTQAGFLDTYTIAAGTLYTTAIHDLINSVLPGLTYNLTISSLTTPTLVYNPGDDPWKAVTDMAVAIGCDIYFDPAGIVTMTPVINPNTAPISWTYQEGATATLLDADRKLTDTGAYSAIVVLGQSSTANMPIRAVSTDTDPASPTYISGPFGQVVQVINSSQVTTQPQAQAMADAALHKSSGLAEQVAFGAFVNPAHDVGDVVDIERLKSKVTGRYLLQSLTIPLRAGQPLAATTRSRTA